LEQEIRLRREDLEWRELEGEIVVLDLRRSTYLAVNRVGALLWPRLLDGATHNDLVQTLVDDFGLASSEAESDVSAFLQDLREQELLIEGT
jgi:coenzyme PQQ synthesis protein D (PqqD)